MGPLSALCGGGSFHLVKRYLCSDLARVMGIDYGLKRAGIAVTDPLQIVVNGLTALDNEELPAFIETYIVKEGVETVVIGMPGSPSDDFENAVSTFAQDLQVQFPALKIVFQNEDFSSQDARRQLYASGVKKKARRDKKLLDQMSAALILSEYLNHSH